MRRRTTFYRPGEDDFNASRLAVTRTALTVDRLHAARQDRFTLQLEELGEGLRALLEQCRELHLRWASPRVRPATGPFASRVAPGLHVHVVPQKMRSDSRLGEGQRERSRDAAGTAGGDAAGLLCPTLRRAFGDALECSQAETSFTPQHCHPSQRCHPDLQQYYHLLPGLHQLSAYVRDEVCGRASAEDGEDGTAETGQTASSEEGEWDCRGFAQAIPFAESLDLDYVAADAGGVDDAANAGAGAGALKPGTLQVSVHWSRPPPLPADDASGGDDEAPPHATAATWSETITAAQLSASRAEIGILAPERALKPHRLAVGGVLVRLGERDDPEPTKFEFASRHHPLPPSHSFTASFRRPDGGGGGGHSVGLHPELHIRLSADAARQPAPSISPSSDDDDTATCALYAHLTLPSVVFPDVYQLNTTDPLWRAKHRLRALVDVAGDTDLEAPDYAVAAWGSTVLLELDVSAAATGGKGSSQAHAGVDVTVPLHLRYLRPTAGGYRDVTLPWPVVFWACATATPRFSPFDRRQIGYDVLFDRESETAFYHVNPLPGAASVSAAADGLQLVETIRVPVLDVTPPDAAGTNCLRSAASVEVVTVVAIVAGLLWVLLKLRQGLNVNASSVRRTERAVAAEEEEVKKTK
ncbi:protease B nonderepressible form [Ascosphaera acerosa]|nr:protease B nonderepressible form [Ascosphaera acerosa]